MGTVTWLKPTYNYDYIKVNVQLLLVYAQDLIINTTFYGDKCQIGLKLNQTVDSSFDTTQVSTNLCPLSLYNISIDTYKTGFIPVTSNIEITSGSIKKLTKKIKNNEKLINIKAMEMLIVKQLKF